MVAGEILSLLARTNLAAGAAIVLVVAVRKAARSRFGSRHVYGLWVLPLLAAGAVLAPARTVIVAAEPKATGSVQMPVFEGGVGAMPIPAATHLSLQPVMVGVWLVGVLVMALAMYELQRRFTKEIRNGAVGPAVVGVIAPRIVTPSDFEAKFSVAERDLVLAHERAHLDRQDSRLNGLSAAFQCLFWFNPLVHLSAHLMRVDQEMACDETVVARFPEARRDYAQALVKAQLATRPLPLGCYWPTSAAHPLLERIAVLRDGELSRRRQHAGALALGLLGAATGLAAWASQPPQMRIATPRSSEVRPVAAVFAASSAPTSHPTSVVGARSPGVEAPTERSPLVVSPDPVVQAPVGYPLAFATTVTAPAESGGKSDADPAPVAPERAWEPNSVVDPTAPPSTVSGVVTSVKWSYPTSEIWLRDGASGATTVVSTEATGALRAAGLNRQSLRSGATITVSGYAARDGSRLYANPADIVANGKSGSIVPSPRVPMLVSLRLSVCGDMANPLLTALRAGQDRQALNGLMATWKADCDAKLARAGG